MRRLFLHFLYFSTLILISSPALAAVVEGQVPVPEPEPVSVSAQRYAGDSAKETAAPGPPIAAVYLEGDFSGLSPGEAKVEVLKQVGHQFVPKLLSVRAGSTVEFLNLDEDYHNILSYSKVKRFDLGRYRKGDPTPTILFDKPGMVKIYCEIHKHMRGVIFVHDSPYFTETDARGNFRIEEVPAGSYKLKVFFSKRVNWERDIEVTQNQTLKADFLA